MVYEISLGSGSGRKRSESKEVVTLNSKSVRKIFLVVLAIKPHNFTLEFEQEGEKVKTRKVAFVTGASRGIGAASSKLIAADKPKLILCAQSAEAIHETKISAESLGAKVETYGFDVSDAKASKNLVDTIIEQHGHIDVLINNAGSGKMGSVADMTPDVFQDVHKINVMGPYNMIHAVLPSMIESDCGTIINLTSARAFIPGRYYAAYCSSKAALISMTQCLLSLIHI